MTIKLEHSRHICIEPLIGGHWHFAVYGGGLSLQEPKQFFTELGGALDYAEFRSRRPSSTAYSYPIYIAQPDGSFLLHITGERYNQPRTDE